MKSTNDCSLLDFYWPLCFELFTCKLQTYSKHFPAVQVHALYIYTIASLMKEEQIYTNKHSQTKLANMVLKYQTGVLFCLFFANDRYHR